jgi:ABC-2 type transport system permease protein
VSEAGDARILDRGYRRYDGPRTGQTGAVRSLITHSVQRALGLRRPVSAKILPALSVFIAYVPAIVFVGITVLFQEVLVAQPDVIPSYSDYYGYVTAAIVVFTAFVAPELLCGDRRDRMLGLYLASPLTRNTYLASKAAAVMGVLGLVTLGPPLFLLLARTIAGTGPDGPGAVFELLWQMVVAGVVIAALQASLSLAVASFTTRRAAASAAIILILIGSAAVSETLLDTGDTGDGVFLLNLFALPFELVHRVYGDPPGVDRSASLSTGVLLAAYLGWTVAFGLLAWVRYRRIEVTR